MKKRKWRRWGLLDYALEWRRTDYKSNRILHIYAVCWSIIRLVILPKLGVSLPLPLLVLLDGLAGFALLDYSAWYAFFHHLPSIIASISAAIISIVDFIDDLIHY